MLRMNISKLSKTSHTLIPAHWNVLNTIQSTKHDPWVSASDTKNYLKNDPLIDWLELYYCKLGFNNNNKINSSELVKKSEQNNEYLNMLFNKGVEFENKIIDNLKTKFKREVVEINIQGRDGKTKENFELTKRAIFDGVPIIYQGVLLNENNKTNGTPDLLVRSDYINKLTRVPSMSQENINMTAKKLKKYHYCVCEIKWSQIPFSSKYLVKNTKFFSAYKGQLAIYNCALGNIQGYFSNNAFILGKGWWAIDDKCTNSFDRLGIVNYNNTDIDIIQKTTQAVKWRREVFKNGDKWSPLDSPKKKNKNMFPNMCNDDLKWNHIKSDIATKTNDPTMISYVNQKHRECLHDNNIYSIFDKKCNTKNMDMNCTLNSEKVDKILNINRSEQYSFLPETIAIDDDLKKSKQSDMFVDFETLNTDFVKKDNNKIDIYDSKTNIFIYMIGVGYLENNAWKYKSFCVDKPTGANEKKIVNEFIDFVSKQKNSKLFHWSQSEISILKRVSENNKNCFDKFLDNAHFIDLYKVFNDKQIVIKGSYTYSLKSIGTALHKLNLIKTMWPNNEIADGQIALFAGCKYYSDPTDKDNIKLFDKILKYNEVDCKMTHEILEFLRANTI